MPSINQRHLTIIITTLLLFLLLDNAISQEPEPSVKITLYVDGYASVEERIEELNNTFVEARLLSRNIENLLVTSGSNLLPYQRVDDVLLIDVEGAEDVVRVYYETPDLTGKEGAYWEFKAYLHKPARILLPENALIVFLNKKPARIGTVDDRLFLDMDVGEVVIGYFLRFEGAEPPQTSIEGYVMVAVLVGSPILATLTAYTYISRRRRVMSLTEDEEKVLNLVRSRGRVSEAEIRSTLHIPKTTLWRIIRKMERRGLVKVRKIGNRNEVEPA